MTKYERIKYHLKVIKSNANYGSRATKAELSGRLTAVYISVCILERLLTGAENERP